MIITRNSGIKDVVAIRMMTFKTTELVVVKNVIAIVIIVVAATTVNSISAYDRIYYSLLVAIVADITVVAAL